jgi:hypothetical protein
MTDTESLAALAPQPWVVLRIARVVSRKEREERI